MFLSEDLHCRHYIAAVLSTVASHTETWWSEGCKGPLVSYSGIAVALHNGSPTKASPHPYTKSMWLLSSDSPAAAPNTLKQRSPQKQGSGYHGGCHVGSKKTIYGKKMITRLKEVRCVVAGSAYAVRNGNGVASSQTKRSSTLEKPSKQLIPSRLT